MFERKQFIIKTFRKGWKVADPSQHPEFKELLDLKKAGKLRSTITQSDPDRASLAHSPYNFHTDEMWHKGEKGDLVDEVLVKELCVPEYIVGPSGEKLDNKEGLLAVDTEEQVIFVFQKLAPYNDKRVSLDLIYGKDLSPEGKKILEDKVPVYYSDIKQTMNTKADKIKK